MNQSGLMQLFTYQTIINFTHQKQLSAAVFLHCSGPSFKKLMLPILAEPDFFNEQR